MTLGEAFDEINLFNEDDVKAETDDATKTKLAEHTRQIAKDKILSMWYSDICEMSTDDLCILIHDAYLDAIMSQ